VDNIPELTFRGPATQATVEVGAHYFCTNLMVGKKSFPKLHQCTVASRDTTDMIGSAGKVVDRKRRWRKVTLSDEHCTNGVPRMIRGGRDSYISYSLRRTEELGMMPMNFVIQGNDIKWEDNFYQEDTVISIDYLVYDPLSDGDDDDPVPSSPPTPVPNANRKNDGTRTRNTVAVALSVCLFCVCTMLLLVRQRTKRTSKNMNGAPEDPLLGEALSSSDIAREYNEAVKNGEQTFLWAKLMFVGQGRAGKTSLLKNLTHQPFSAEEAITDGADVCVIHNNTWEKSEAGLSGSTFDKAVAEVVGTKLGAQHESEPLVLLPTIRIAIVCGILLLVGLALGLALHSKDRVHHTRSYPSMSPTHRPTLPAATYCSDPGLPANGGRVPEP
jgi:hypothetical protein